MARLARIIAGICFGFCVPAQAQTAPESAPPAPPGDRPPPEYYVEPPAAESRAAPAQRTRPPTAPVSGGVYEPPPPGAYAGPGLIYEPPPPPKPRHVAPKYSFWVGPRVGWFVPFGNMWFDCRLDAYGDCSYSGREWNDVASAGPMFEIDVGARLSRNYNLFALWERASLSGASEDDAGGAVDSASTDYIGVGLRVTSDPDKVGFLTEISLGARRFKVRYEDGSELRATQDLPFEARLGFGADIRISPLLSLSPMLTLGVGRFDEFELELPSGQTSDPLQRYDELASHGWLTLQIGAHFDVAGGEG